MRPEKKAIAEEIQEHIDGSVFVILADYRGLSVGQTETLRNKLLESDARMQVVKNRILRLADDRLGEGLKGPSAMVYGKGDVVQAAKVLGDFIKENKLPVIKVGSLEGVILSPKDIATLANLPSKEQLQAQVVRALAAPMGKLVGVMSQKIASLVYVLKAVQEKKEAA